MCARLGMPPRPPMMAPMRMGMPQGGPMMGQQPNMPNMPNMPQPPAQNMDEPPSKKAKTEESLIPEDIFLKTHKVISHELLWKNY